MSVSNTIKSQLIDKIQACASVQQVYGHEEDNPAGWPAVMVTAGDMQGEFSSNAENSRVYAFSVLILVSIGQDFSGMPSGTNRMEYAEQMVATVVDEIINAVDTNFELEGTPVLYVNAADVSWGYTAGEFGEARSASLSLRVYTEKVI